MTEEDQDSLRPTSPYHEKCFPPYCDNAGQLDKQVVSKMNRKELEDKYIVYADENLNLKKRIREHERHIQRLQTAMARQDNLDKKGGAKLPPSMQLENARVENLEMQNKNLQAKVKVLKQQLMNHSFIHTKENKIAENKEKNYKNPDYFRDVGQTQSARDSKHRYNSPTASARELNNVSALKERIAELENMLEAQKEKYKTRIAQLEKEVAAMGKSGGNLNEELNEHSRKVNDNVEIIKLRRDGKKLSKDIDVLNDQNDALRKELEELKVALKKANESVAELERILERERERARDGESNLSKSMSHTETIRALQEEIRDLKNERKELKEANEQLLLLTTTSPKGDRSESKLKQQISALEVKLREKSKELEDMAGEVARLEALLKDSDNTLKSQVEARPSTRQGLLESGDLQSEINLVCIDKEDMSVYVSSKGTSPAQKGKKESDKNRDEGEKVQQLKKLLAEVQDELEELRAIADDHRKNCLKTQTPEPVVQQRPKRKWPDPKLVVEFGNKNIPSVECSRMVLMKIHSRVDQEKATSSSSPASEITKQNVEEKSNGHQLSARKEVIDLTAHDTPCGTLHTRISDSGAKKCSLEVQSVDYAELAGDKPTEKTQLPPAPSEHEVEQVPGESPTKPVLVIVSKHEFDAVLLQKKKFYSETEVMVPTRGQRPYNCKMEICVYDLEVDNRMVDQILKMEENPMVFVTWNFLGLEQSTLNMPITQAHFHTNVVYSGPLSEEMARYVNQSEMVIYLMLVKSDGSVERVGEGSLSLTPAIDQPDRGFLRCVNLSGNHGSAMVYCSFKLHECCPGAETGPPPAETLEVGIGHLKLNDHENTSPDANHLYVEYSLLGYCGPELETDSVPKSDVMRFNHTKRLKVNESNAKHLEPMLKPNHAKTLRFIILAEPCSLTQETEIEEVGHADLNLMEEMVQKDQDLISTEIPVYDNHGQLLGSLSVTVIGNSTLQNYVKK